MDGSPRHPVPRVALHARAGARLAQRISPLGFLAREIAGEVPALMAQLAARR